MDKYAECGKCGSTDIKRCDIATGHAVVYECADCGASMQTQNKFGFMVYRDWARKAAKPELPFEGCGKKELDEMSAALDLLLEHSVAREYLVKFQSDLQAVLQAS